MKLSLIGILVVLSVLVISNNATSCSRKDFEIFKTQYNKVYTNSQEEQQRFEIFCSNFERINKKTLEQQNDKFEFGITKFSDLTQEEFKIFLGYRPKPNLNNENQNSREIPTIAAPQTFDWRSHPGILTPVKNQGQCGSCWAFSATENIESQWALANHTLVSLAPQQIVDCDTQDSGCNGGDPRTAYDYVKQAGGLEPEADYPYTGKDGKCKFEKSKAVATVTGWEWAGKSNEPKMVDFLVAHGPISICVDASSWNDYKSGILPASKCGHSLDHCVLAVGYDLNNKYWIVRNSWGKDWGVENGYIYLEYGKNTCGMADEPTCAKV